VMQSAEDGAAKNRALFSLRCAVGAHRVIVASVRFQNPAQMCASWQTRLCG
jgi:hypothetical protein